MQIYCRVKLRPTWGSTSIRIQLYNEAIQKSELEYITSERIAYLRPCVTTATSKSVMLNKIPYTFLHSFVIMFQTV